ncbi:small G protein signaling modulator 2-like [Hibiscus syriacus]|uniref:small G protein signaling modulator 2-like n=1 Tax=Hibiscus syriacus TaxID=106335 RepID=UPI001924CC28|nr:small G protein signaling modulator 2-like [Hibiscus syriacus]
MSPTANNSPTGINHFGGGGGFWSTLSVPPLKTAVAVTAVAGLAVVAAVFFSTTSGRLRSPWSRFRKKHALTPQQWRSLFTPDGRLQDGGVKFLKEVRCRGVDTSIRAEVWPFLLGVYDLNSSKEERDAVRIMKRKEYEKLRRKCRRILRHDSESCKLSETGGTCQNGDSGSLIQEMDTSSSEDVVSARESLSREERNPVAELSDEPSSTLLTNDDVSTLNSSDSDSSEDPEVTEGSHSLDGREENDPDIASERNVPLSCTEGISKLRATEDFSTWQRIIRLDAVRANADWMPYSPSQASVSDDRARHAAEAVGLKDYDQLEPCRIFHAARLVSILEAYALYDCEIGYCQGMSDLLSPIVSVVPEDYEAFWCFVGFMKKARHNFRLDEVGIRRQLNIVSKIIKCKDSQLYKHLEKMQAEDCFFVYRMVVVLFRTELTFEQTVCLWEVMWADQAAIRAGISKSAWSSMRQRAPPTDDLLLYAIAASVLQRRKWIIEKYSSMDEILRECNSMAGQLDVWKLLNDAYDLVATLYDKIESSF